ncbi:MAG: pantoate--beta-alanine ligase [Planctomycetes bacterium]|nr:pantoate--beta-alanine ligase [Planctomycetota bacterium]
MEQCISVADQSKWSEEQRLAGKRIAFVATMGALHRGHAALIQAANKTCDVVVVSIYVNPTQFDNPDDLEDYPRQLESDLKLCEHEGVGAVFMPTVEEMFPQKYSTFIDVVGSLQESLCAVARPGHFRGVCTIVAKLFNIVRPHVALFGQKDLQQVLFIQRMTSDLGFQIEIEVVPTVREDDGLAMSSRNQRLSAETRENVRSIPRGLQKVNRAFRAGKRNSADLMTIFAEEVLMYEDVDLDYADVVDLDGFEMADEANEHCIFAVAVVFDGVRLIDHILLGSPDSDIDMDL